MKHFAAVGLLIGTFVSAVGMAQQANQNINVLPVYYNQANDPTQPIEPDAYLKGDLFLQRQVEPTIAVSSWNSQHLIAFFNDYRAVDIPDDLGVGEDGAGASSTGTLKSIVAKVLHFLRPGRDVETELPEQAAASEAWVGGSRSYDGGITWTGFFVPGGPFDDSPASLASPVKGFEASTDPVAASGPCGTVYLAYLAFTRGENSMMVVSRWQDTNTLIGGDTWEYQGTAVLETGNNAEFGFFLDKPHIAVDYVRNGGGACDHNIYASYTTFNGRERDGKFKSKVTFARSSGDELGFDTNFDIQKLNAPFQQNQGTWIVVDPRPGTPNTTGGGTIHLFWRHFFDPNAILTITSKNYGQTFPGNPSNITAGWDLETYDQIGYSTTAAVGAGFPTEGTPDHWDPPAIGGQAGVEDIISFRSNAFPTAAISEQGTIFVAWQERVDLQPGETQGFPAPYEIGGSPRIVMTKSIDGGSSWQAVDGTPGARRAVDLGRRDDPINPKAELAEDGWGQLPQPRDSGPQVMPSLSCGLGRCLLIFSESRGFLVEDGFGEQRIELYDLSTSSGFISGIDRMMDMRAARIDPLSGELVSTTQISRYTLAPAANLADGESPEDIAAVNWPCSPDDDDLGSGLPDCDRAINLPVKPQSAAGTVGFIGDYFYVIPLQSWKHEAAGGWRRAISSNDLDSGAPAFHAIWADNRNLIPPKAEPEWPEYQAYDFQFDPATGEISGTSGLCPTYWGAKNTDVLTARVDAPLILSLPNNFKQVCDGIEVPCDFPRSFPVLITNGTDTDSTGEYGSRFYRVSFTGTEPHNLGEAPGVSFSQFDPDLDWGDVELLPWSSSTAVVWVAPGATGPVQVHVQEIDGIYGELVPGGFSGIVTINDETSLGLVQNPGINEFEVHSLQVSNPQTSNPQTSNPQTSNPQTSNLFIANPQTSNPQTSNLTLTDSVTWTIQPGDTNVINSAGVAINIDNPELYANAGVAFQLIIYSLTSNGGLDLDACSPVQTPQAQIISSIATPPGDVSLVTNPQTSNPQTSNTLISNPQTSNPQTSNPQTSNAAFTVAPADTSSDGLNRVASLQGSAPAPTPAVPTNDGTLKAALNRPQVFVTLLAFCDADQPEGCDPDIFNPDVDPPSILVNSLSCDEPFISIEESCNFVSPSPDLKIAGSETVSFLAVPASVKAGDTVTFPVAEGCDPASTTCQWSVTNDSSGSATPENGDLTHGVYLSPNASIFLPNGNLDPSAGLVGPLEGGSVLQLPQFDASSGQEPGPGDSFLPGDIATFDSFDVVIPEDTEPGNYFLHLWIDDGREISEFIEPNNVISAPIEVTAANSAPINVEIGIDVEAREGEPVTLTVTFDDPGADPGESYQYLWDFGDGNSCDSEVDENCGASAIHTFAADGTYTITVTVIDAEDLEGSGSLGVTVLNVAPIANDDNYTTPEETTLTVTVPGVLGNDTDAGKDALTAVLLSGLPGLSLSSDGSFIYTPAANANGTVSFTYKANDGLADSNAATATITVLPVDDVPVAVDDSYTTVGSGLLTVGAASGVLANDLDIDTATADLTAILVAGASNGTVSLNGDGSFTYDPGPDFYGQDEFTYKANDGTSDSNIATVTIGVEYGFNGLLSPWKPPSPQPYTIKLGSAFPVRWQYTDPATGLVVESSGTQPTVEVLGPLSSCNASGDGSEPIQIFTPGNSTYQYDTRLNIHQLNVDSDNLAVNKCYDAYVHSGVTGQLNGPFIFKVKR